jgi:hypothetical protein
LTNGTSSHQPLSASDQAEQIDRIDTASSLRIALSEHHDKQYEDRDTQDNQRNIARG